MRDTGSLVVRTLCLAPILVPCAGHAVFTYSDAFSNNPAWTTDDPTQLRWDASRQTFRGTQRNWDRSYAYIHLPAFDPNSLWTLSLDLLIHSMDWSSGLTIGLFDNTLISGNGAAIDMSEVDGGLPLSLLTLACLGAEGMRRAIRA